MVPLLETLNPIVHMSTDNSPVGTHLLPQSLSHLLFLLPICLVLDDNNFVSYRFQTLAGNQVFKIVSDIVILLFV